MSKTFKYNPETLEVTTRHKRYGNSRKKLAVLAVKERRKRRKEEEALYEREHDLE
jgi:hypothetical protein